MSTPCQTGCDQFPKENCVAYVYPDQKDAIEVNGQIMSEFKPFHTSDVIRKIYVAGFWVEMKVSDFTFNRSKKGRVSNLELAIRLLNGACENIANGSLESATGC